MSAAKSEVSITKLATVEISEKQHDFLILNNLSSNLEGVDGHLCFLASKHSPLHRIALVESEPTELVSAKNGQAIAYSASINHAFFKRNNTYCGGHETELTIGISTDDAEIAQDGFFSDNLMVMIIIE